MERPLTGHIKKGEAPPGFREYYRAGGYNGTIKALKEMTPAGVTSLVKASNLLGRGGAGFPTGVKWSLVPMEGENIFPKYLVCNADEMEPGTFKDRLLLEGNPHQLIAGMIAAAYAIQAGTAYIFLRWAYKKAERELRKAISEAYREGFLGKNILGTGFNLDIHVHTSAGRYICGEETALLNALEGKRGIPRTKPPFPATSGLFGKPTVVNNVETLSWISHIVEKGADWFKGLSLTGTGGTKLYGVSGRVKRPGLWELPLGVTIGEIINEHAGGMHDGYAFRGVLPGGASTDFLVEEHLDVKMDFSTVAAAGSRLGTGTMIVLDDRTCPVAFLQNVEKFYALESCGWCTPCREGLPWVEKMLSAIEDGKGKMEYLDILKFHTSYMGPGHTFCAHAPGAAEPLQSGLRFFHDDFKRHIEEKKCPWK
ncbi:MAG TPA: NADH-quinone oxidoreductase subunit NuoF [Bacteroidales bacterium]|nr:NADH-quinone oxidoreductase subunit NuoF [Bacteroidales bacterium]HNR42234.1 NADH-quinone oxidoreductase subunit NuoF [Bacteroidales bacterium]HPM17559.1 NADH-quinone oxidoreductase subunit NuoF [Bacteroidales bacterium]HPV16803.1 NADH-quinone oxidoreductase subunit NuoF [Bacteroidales bacterium]